MATLYGIHGQSFNSGTEELIAVWKNAPMIRSGSQWTKAPIHLTANLDTYMSSFLDGVFLTNGTNPNYWYNGSVWAVEGGGSSTNVYGSPIGKFNYAHSDNRVYLYDVDILGTAYRSRVCFSDLPANNQISWGFESGSDLSQTADSGTITSASAKFKTKNIKVGDPFTITTGDNAGEYVVQSIDSETQITLTVNLSNTATNSSYWVGGNWFDVYTDDGDVANGISSVSNEIMFFKKKSVHRYNSLSKTLRQIKNAPGTTSSRSIVRGSDGYTYWYHPTGVWRTLGTEGERIDAAVEDIISAVSSTNQSKVCGWEEDGKRIVMALGDITLRDGDTITNCEIAFDENTENWRIQSRPTQILVATNWLESNVPKVYAGDGSDSVYQLNTGTGFVAGSTTTAISTQVTLYPIFPAGSESMVDFTRLRMYVDNGLDIQIFFKRIYYPTRHEDQWYSDENWTSMKGSQRGSRSEWHFPEGIRASGIQLKLAESSSNESFLEKKMVIYYSNEANR